MLSNSLAIEYFLTKICFILKEELSILALFSFNLFPIALCLSENPPLRTPYYADSWPAYNVHSIYYKYSPESLHDTWITNEQRGINQDLRDSHQLYTPFARTDHVKRLPYFSFPKIWNELPDFKLSRNPITFKIALKWHLHNLAP